MIPLVQDSLIEGRLALVSWVLAGPGSRRLLEEVRSGIECVDRRLESELASADTLSNVTSRYRFDSRVKRVRPVLALLTAQLGDGITAGVVDAVTAFELTDLGSRYHDDVTDEADSHRGARAAHSKRGNGVAILTGDVLFSRATQLMAGLGARVIKVYTDTFERLVLGQMHEAVGPYEGDNRVELYLEVLGDKSGSLVGASAVVGALLGNAPEEYHRPLMEFGERAGVAFRLLDDVVDLLSDQDGTRRFSGADPRAGIPTMPLLLLGQRDDDASVHLFQRIDEGIARVADGADPGILDGPIGELRDHDATRATRELAGAWSRDAISALSPIPNGPVREGLTRLALALTEPSRRAAHVERSGMRDTRTSQGIDHEGQVVVDPGQAKTRESSDSGATLAP